METIDALTETRDVQAITITEGSVQETSYVAEIVEDMDTPETAVLLVESTALLAVIQIHLAAKLSS